MIDEHDMAESESSILALSEKKPSAKEWMMNEAEIIRNARRYLALRKQFAPFSMDVDGNHSWCWRGNPSRMKGPTLDAAADRLLESGE